MPGQPTKVIAALVAALSAGCPLAAKADLSCSLQRLSVTKPKVDAFLRRPETSLELYPRGDADGGKDMQISMRELVAADLARTLDPILKLVPRANDFQQKAIGAGLGDAARQCNRAARPADAQRLIQAVKTTNSRTTLMAFMASYVDPAAPIGLETDQYVPRTNPLGNGNVASPAANVFKEPTIRSPFNLNDPFAPVR